MTTKIIYFMVNGRLEKAEFRSSCSAAEVKGKARRGGQGASTNRTRAWMELTEAHRKTVWGGLLLRPPTAPCGFGRSSREPCDRLVSCLTDDNRKQL